MDISMLFAKEVNMGSLENAIVDGIEYYAKEVAFGGRKQERYVYKVPCPRCNRITEKIIYRRDVDNLCDICKKTIKEKKKYIISQELEAVETKSEKRFRQAVCEIKKQVKNMQQYERAIEIAKSRIDKYGSIPEAMVAIELIKLGYKIIPQQKVGKYRVDFAIPKQKLIIEVDGKLFHQKITDREASVQLAFGLEWKIIHIPAELISKDITKMKKIMNLYSSK